MAIPNTKINRNVVRLIVDNELSHDDVKEFFDIVDEIIDTESVEVVENAKDTSVLVYKDNNVYAYEIPISRKATEDQSLEITQEFADVYDKDFQVEID